MALRVACPFRSVVALAADADMLAMRRVLVLSTRMRAGPMPKARAAMSRIFVLCPCPISTPPVVTLTLPSVYTCTRADAWLRKVLVKEMPKHTGITARPRLWARCPALNADAPARRRLRSCFASTASQVATARARSAR